MTLNEYRWAMSMAMMPPNAPQFPCPKCGRLIPHPMVNEDTANKRIQILAFCLNCMDLFVIVQEMTPDHIPTESSPRVPLPDDKSPNPSRAFQPTEQPPR